ELSPLDQIKPPQLATKKIENSPLDKISTSTFSYIPQVIEAINPPLELSPLDQIKPPQLATRKIENSPLDKISTSSLSYVPQEIEAPEKTNIYPISLLGIPTLKPKEINDNAIPNSFETKTIDYIAQEPETTTQILLDSIPKSTKTKPEKFIKLTSIESSKIFLWPEYYESEVSDKIAPQQISYIAMILKDIKKNKINVDSQSTIATNPPAKLQEKQFDEVDGILPLINDIPTIELEDKFIYKTLMYLDLYLPEPYIPIRNIKSKLSNYVAVKNIDYFPEIALSIKDAIDDIDFENTNDKIIEVAAKNDLDMPKCETEEDADSIIQKEIVAEEPSPKVQFKDLKIDEYELRRAYNISLLIDRSSSMNKQNRFEILKNSILSFIDLLGDRDRISIMFFNDSLYNAYNSGEKPIDKNVIQEIFDNQTPTGMTKGTKGLYHAYQKLQGTYNAEMINTVILATDGEITSNAKEEREIVTLIHENAQNNKCFLSIIGFGSDQRMMMKMGRLSELGNGKFIHIQPNVSHQERLLVEELYKISIK
nr:VWA domain-containing protein [Chitinophagales bacterium]